MDIAVLGAGYAGVTVAQRLESALPDDASLTIVDERETHLVQHLVHRVIRSPDLAADLQIPLEDLLDSATIRQERVAAVEPATGTVEFAEAGETRFDLIAVCLGARTAFGSMPGVREHGQPLKSVEHALAIGERFEEVCDTGGAAGSGVGRVLVGGAGTSGVQVAGELAELASERAATVEIELLEQRETIVPSFPPAFQRAVRDELSRRGVEIRTEATVSAADADAVALADGSTHRYDQFVWAGGITGQAAMGDHRPEVPATLRLADRVFAAGDAGRVVDADGRAVPATAQTALAQGRVAARNIERLADHRMAGDGGFEPRLERYRHDPLGWLVSVGDAAVAQLGPTVVRGAPARAIKRSIGLGYLSTRGRVGNALSYVREHLFAGV